MAGLLFGTAESPIQPANPKTRSTASSGSPNWGWAALELEFVYGVRMSEAEADQVADTAAQT